MFEITVTTAFSAAHALRLPDGTLEPMHGHDWRVGVTVSAEGLDAMGAVMDFHDLQALLEAAVVAWRNSDLNTHAPFSAGVERGDDGSQPATLAEADTERAWNPTAERVTQEIALRLGMGLPAGVSLREVSVTEAIGCVARHRPGA